MATWLITKVQSPLTQSKAYILRSVHLGFYKVTLPLRRKLLVENTWDRLQKTDYRLIFIFDMNYSSHLLLFAHFCCWRSCVTTATLLTILKRYYNRHICNKCIEFELLSMHKVCNCIVHFSQLITQCATQNYNIILQYERNLLIWILVRKEIIQFALVGQEIPHVQHHSLCKYGSHIFMQI